jgi:anaerobic magnesium-protoporphyrin IX monomethyl ester cyclase
MPEILLVNPPNDPTIGPPYIHLGLAYLAACLQADGFNVEVLDACLNSIDNENILRLVQEVSPPPILVGFTVINDRAWNNAQYLCEAMKGLWPGSVFVAGGYFATFWFEEILKCAAMDLVVRGEGEATLLDIARHVRRQENIYGIAGTAACMDDQVICAPPRALIEELDDLPFPYRPQASEILLHGGVPSIYSSRGCYNTCSFCQVSELYRSQPGKFYRQRSVPNVMAEIMQLQKVSHANYILFTDDEFIGSRRVGRKRALELAMAIQSQDPGLHFAFQCRADSVEQAFFSQLKDSGLQAVSIGIESLIQRSLDLFNKHIRVEQNLRAIDILYELGLDINIGMILFDPYTTLDELAEHITLIQKLPVLPQSFNGLSVLKGTPLEHHFRDAQMLNARGTYYEVQPIDSAVKVFQRLTRAYNDLHRDATNFILATSALHTALPNMAGDVEIDLYSLRSDLRDVHRHFLSISLGYLKKNESRLTDHILDQLSPTLSILTDKASALYDRAQSHAAGQFAMIN